MLDLDDNDDVGRETDQCYYESIEDFAHQSHPVYYYSEFLAWYLYSSPVFRHWHMSTRFQRVLGLCHRAIGLSYSFWKLGLGNVGCKDWLLAISLLHPFLFAFSFRGEGRGTTN
jgi:hypothetical protein